MTTDIRVLHVDDEPDLVDVAADFLERNEDRMVVRTATSVEEGLKALDDADFDCLVSDYDMPGLNGIEFLGEVREMYASLPFILYTGKGSEEIASEAIAAGVTDYLQKGRGTDQYTVLANRIVNAVTASRTEAQLEETLARVADSIYSLDTEWRFTSVNEQAEQLLERDEEDLLGEIIWEAFPEAAGGIVEEHYRTAMEAQATVSFEYYYKPLDVWVDVNVYPSETGLTIYFLDISDRKKQEQARRESQAYFEALVEHSTDVITVIGTEGTITYESPAVERVLGYETEELVGRNGFEFIHTGDHGRVQAALAELREAPSNETVSVQFRFQHADGSWIWLESVGSKQEAGPVEGYVLNSRDVTERKDPDGEPGGSPEQLRISGW